MSPQRWRGELSVQGLSTGNLITPHPWETLEHWTLMAASVIAALYLAGHGITDRGRFHLALIFCAGAAVYAVVSMILQTLPVRPVWDPRDSFGIFPNRNHTATFLSMGTVAGLGVLFQSLRHRDFGAAALAGTALVVCLCGAAGFSGSRGGVLLTCGGALTWMALLGRRYVTPRAGLAGLFVASTAATVFLFSEAAVKPRLAESVDRLSTLTGNALFTNGESAAADLEKLDLRLPIMRETLTMLKSEPWCGTGFGTFPYIFPRYQRTSAAEMNSSRVIHPESDWLWLAAEAGPGTAAVLLAGISLTVFRIVRGARRERGWPVRLACLIAALLVPFHGLFDVPGHRIGLAWFSIIFMAAALPHVRSREAGGISRLCFRAGGISVIGAGALFLAGGWSKIPFPSTAEQARLYTQACALYSADVAEQAAAIHNEKPVPGPLPGQQDKLSLALATAGRALELAPLNPDLHYFQGALALHFDDQDALADAAFARQRLLVPLRIDIALRQAAAWAGINPTRTRNLWKDAIARSRLLEKISPEKVRFSTHQTFKSIMRQVRETPALAITALEAAEDDPEFLRIWVASAPKEALRDRVRDLFSQEMPRELREELQQQYKKRGVAPP